MNYIVEKNKIIINDLSDFNIEHILECGQIFTYQKCDGGMYKVFSADKFATVVQNEDSVHIKTETPQYFVDFFDLNTDYTQIKQKLITNEKLKKAIDFGYGIRIVKQDILEVIIGFIISANNNIERIKKTMSKLREYGQNKGEYFAFPTIEELEKISIQNFKDMGAGYRAGYLVETIKALKAVDFQALKTQDTKTLKNWLLSLKGVGPKVADCILLFGFSRCESFPVDTWIEKVYFDLFGQIISREKMSQHLVEHFGELSGYAQQYLFFYKRSIS